MFERRGGGEKIKKREEEWETKGTTNLSEDVCQGRKLLGIR